MVRTGRRPGSSDTREAILEAARLSFSEEGYDGSTIRGIAGRAQVDPALVHHYFGNKEGLFVAAMKLPVDPGQMLPRLLEGGTEGLGERILRLFLTIWDSEPTRSPFVALVRSASSNERAATLLREFIGREIIGRVAEGIQADHAELRAALVGSQLIGLGMARYIIQIEPLASVDSAAIVASIAPTIQHYLTGDLADVEW